MILTPLQKLTKNVGYLGKIIVVKCFELLPKVEKNAQSGHNACRESVFVDVGGTNRIVARMSDFGRIFFVRVTFKRAIL